MRSSSAGRVNGTRTNESSPPSTAKTDPGETTTPRRSASITSAVAPLPGVPVTGSSHHSDRPPRGRRKRQSGSSDRRAAARASRCSRSRPRWSAHSSSRRRSSRAATSCSSTGLPRSSATRASISRSSTPSGQRTHPIRRPPQKLLLVLPSVTVSGARAANGRGIGRPSRARDWCDSSTTGVVPARRSSAATCSRSAFDMRLPVGLWKSGIRYASCGRVSCSSLPTASRSQPSTSIGSPTRRAPARRSAAWALG